MSKECSQPDNMAAKQGLICSGIWGGVQNSDQDVNTDGLTASVFSSSADGGKGGDMYYIGACKGCKLTRVAVADVVGHGQAVSDVSQYMYDSLKAHICDPDSGAILSELNQVASQQGLEAMTTAVVVAYSGINGTVLLSRAGHPPVLLKRANQEQWSVAETVGTDKEGDSLGADIPLAVAPETTYRQQAISVTSGDRFFVYTDGVTEAPSPTGELFGTERLNEVLNANAQATLSELKSAVLRSLHQHAGNTLTHDDVTLVAMEIR